MFSGVIIMFDSVVSFITRILDLFSIVGVVTYTLVMFSVGVNVSDSVVVFIVLLLMLNEYLMLFRMSAS